MNVRIKICGMTSLDDVALCADAGADALGFIFAAGERRLTVEAAAELTRAAPPFVTTVGVFANDEPSLVGEAVRTCRLDVLQFSGDEDPERCGTFGKPTILSVRGRRFDARQLAAARASALLVDAWSPTEFGGTGRVLDRDAVALARAHHDGMPLILAGGLTPANVATMIRACGPDAVDARSGVERDGRKDPALVRAFVRAARTALDGSGPA
jgi:phosphoribosylanthranilate isomerase